MNMYLKRIPDKEMWRQCIIPGFDNYWISSLGSVKNSVNNRELSPVEQDGYLKVQLNQNNKHKTLYVHRLVAQHFLTGYRPGAHVGWRDGNHHNNSLENLFFKGDRGLGLVISPRKVYQERRLEIVETGQSFMNVMKAANFLNTSPQGIYQVLTGRRKTHLGYHFRWIDI